MKRGGILLLTILALIFMSSECGRPDVLVINKVNEDGSINRKLVITYDEDEFDLERLRRAYNSDDAVEFGAEALSILLVKEQTSYTAIERAYKKTGIDYWLMWFKKNGHFAKNDNQESEVFHEFPKNQKALHTRVQR